MGIIARQSFWNSASSYASIGLAAFNNILLVPWVFSMNPEEQWGLIQYLMGLVLIIAPLAHLGLPNAIIRFMPRFREEGKPAFLLLITTMFTLSLSLVSLGFLVYYFHFASDGAPEELAKRFLPLVIPMLAGHALMNVFGSFAKARYKTVFPTFIKELLVRISTTLLLVLYGFGVIAFTHFLLLYVFVQFLQGVVILFYIYRLGELKFSRPLRFPSKSNIRDILTFTLFSFLGGEASALMGKMDIILIKEFLDLKAVAYYAIPFYAGNLISAPLRAIGPITFTIVSEYWNQGKMDKLLQIYRQTAIAQLIIGGFIFLALWLNVDILMHVLGDKFGTNEAKWVFLLVGLGQLIGASAGVNGQILITSPSYRIELVIQVILALLTISFQVLLIPSLGITGAALGAGLAIIAYNALRVIFLKIKYNLQPYNRQFFKVILLILLPFISLFLSPYFDSYTILFILRMIILCAVFGFGIFVWDVSEEIRANLMGLIQRFRKRKP